MTLKCQAHRLSPRTAIERFQEWVYHTNHPLDAVTSDGYFDAVCGRILKGDVIEVYSVAGETVENSRLLVTKSTKAGVAVAMFALLRVE